MSEQFHIETPENISFQYDVAGIGSRFLANLIDSLIQGSLYALLIFAASMLFSRLSTSSLSTEVSNWIVAIILLVIFLIQFGYFIVFEIALAGQTPGKRVLGLRVMKENGYPLGVADCLIRNIIRIIDFFPFAYGVGLIAMFASARAKRLGDFAAGTIVVKVREEVKLKDLERPWTDTLVTPAVELAGIENLRETEIELAESFLKRRYELRNANALGNSIARAILARMNAPETRAYAETMPAEIFLRQVVAAYRQPKTPRE